MNYVQAMKALFEGKKIRQTTWEEDFYIYMEDDHIIDEKGTMDIFLLSTKPCWELYEEKPILTDNEKDYLSTVIKPFRNRVKTIKKHSYADKEYVLINLTDNNDDIIFFPSFEIGKYYKGMKIDVEYTLDELGI